MTSFRYLIPRYEVYTVPQGCPGLLEYMDYPDVGSLSMPTPLLVVHGQQIIVSPDGVKTAIENLRRCYHAIGRPERFDTLFFDGPHKFPLQAQQKMMDWFGRWV